MNKIYRTVYNETTGTWVAVEETAKSHRKSAGVVNESAPAREVLSGSLKGKTLTVIATSLALLSPFMASEASAAEQQIGILCQRTADGKIRLYFEAKTDSTTCTNGTFVQKVNLSDTVTSPAFTNNTRPTSGNSAISFGYQDGFVYRDENGDDVFGTSPRSGVNSMPGTPGGSSYTAHHTYVGVPVSKKREVPGAHGNNDIAIGTNAAAHGERTDNKGVDFVANFNDPDNALPFDTSGYYLETGGAGNAIALGNQAKAVRSGAIAVGYQSAAGENAIAIGNFVKSNRTTAVTPNSIAIGSESGIRGIGGLNTALDDPSKGGDSIALGNNATNWTQGTGLYDWHANTKNSVAIGHNAHTHAANAFAIGTGTDALGERSFAIGTVFTQNSKDEQEYLDKGVTKTRKLDDPGAIKHRGSLAAGQGSIVIGDQARTGFLRSGISDDNSSNIGTNDSVAIGTGSLVSARNALALGGGISYTYHDISKDAAGNPIAMDNRSRYYLGKDNAGNDIWEQELDHETFASIGAKVGKGADGAIALGGASADISEADNTLYPTTAADDLTVDNYVKAAEVKENAKRSIAMGGGAFVDEGAIGSVAIGGKGLDEATKSTIGTYAHNALAMIGGTVANSAENAIAVGNNAKSDIKNAIAFGTGAHAIGEVDYPAIAMGQNANATKARTIAIGQDSKAQSNGSVTIGYKATSGTNDGLSNSVAIGQNATSTHLETVAIGGTSAGSGPITQATGKGAIAIGGRAQATSGQSIAIGQHANTEPVKPGSGARRALTPGDQSIAIGAETLSTGNAAIAIGGDDVDDTDLSGIDKTYADGEDFALLKDTANISKGSNQTTASGNVSIAMGTMSQSKGHFSNAIGFGAETGANHSIAMGTGAYTGTNAANSVSIGYMNKVTGSNSIAIGQKNVVLANNMQTIGDPNTFQSSNGGVSGNNNAGSAYNSRIVGSDNTIGETDLTQEKYNDNTDYHNIFVLGNNITMTNSEGSNSVYLGSNSAYVTKGTTSAGVSQYTDAYTIGSVTYDNNFAAQGTDGMGVVSVGANDKERRIQNVAAGLISADSTDAINGSQLNAAYENLQWRISADKSTGGDINTAIDSEVVGKYTGSKNGGNVKFLAGDGVKITTSRDATTDGSLNLEFSMNTTTVSNTDNGSLKLDDISKGNSPATAASVVNAVNNSYWVATDGTKSANVKPSNKVNWTGADGVKVDLNTTTNTFTAKLDNTYLPTVTGDNTTAWVAPETDGNHQKYTVSAVDTLVTNGTGIAVSGGDVDPTTKQRTYTVALDQTTQDDINSKLSTLKTRVVKGGTPSVAQTLTNATDKDNADFIQGDNIELTAANNGITIATAKDVKFDSVETTNLTATGETKLGDKFTVANDGTVTYSNSNPTNANEVVNKTYADSLGWNLQVNGVKQGETITNGKAVNFANGSNTTMKYEGGAVKVDVNTTTLTATDGKVDNLSAGGDNLTTAQNVADMINQTYWIAQDGSDTGTAGEQISAGDKVVFQSADGSVTVKRTTNSFDFKVNKGTDPVVSTTDGTVSGGVADTYWDSKQVENAINQSGWIITSSTAGSDEQLVQAGGKVDLKAGNGVKIEQSGKNFTFSVDNSTLNAGGNKPLEFKGDAGETVSPKFGDTVNVKGNAAVAADLTDGNIGVVGSASDNTLTVKLNKDVDLGSSGSLKMGDTTINNGGVTVNGGSQPVTITKNGLDNGGNTITNVAEGVNSTDAVNVSQLEKGLKAARTQVVAGDNIKSVDKTAGTNGEDIYTVNAVGVKAAPGNKYIQVTGGGKDDFVIDDSLIDTAIGNASFKLTSSNQGASTGVTEEIKKGDTVTINGGSDNIEITQTGGTITVDVAKDVKFDSVETGTLKAGDTKLGDNFEVKGGKVTYNQTPTDDNEVVNKKYADSLGWDLQVNGTKQGDTITNGKAVNFADGDNTTVKFEDNAVKVSVNTTTLTATDGKVNTPTTGGDNLTTAQNVADMINQTYWIASDGSNKTNVSAGNTVKWTGGKYTDVALSGDTFTVKSTLDIQQDATTGDVVIKDGDTVLANIAKGSDTVTSVVAGDNITVTPNMTDPSKPEYKVALNKDVTLDKGSITITGDTNTVNITGDNVDMGGNQIHNVAAGVADDDAVNVGQLKQVTNIVTGGKDSVDIVTYNVQDRGEHHNQSVVEAIDNINAQGIQFFHTNQTGVTLQVDNTNDKDSSAGGAFATAIGVKANASQENAVAIGHETEATGVNAISIGAGNTVSGSQSIAVGTNLTVRGNNSGAFGDPTEINGSDSYSVGNGNKISTNKTFALGNEITQTKENSVFLGDRAAYTAAGASTAGTETYDKETIRGKEYTYAGGTPTGVVSVGDVGKERRIQNVAAGKISADSTDAINGSQLFALQDTVNNLTEGAAGPVQYSNADGDRTGISGPTNDVTLVGKEAAPVTIHNVAPGRAPTDAVNVSQLNQAVGDIHNRIGDVSKHADASAASAIAVASMPQAFLPGKNLVAIGGGTYHGQTGYAIGVSTISDNGHWIVKGTATGNSKNRYGAGIGAGYQW